MHIEIEMIAHGLGFAGEALNLYGAFILAKDLLEREEELSDRDGLEELTNWLTANGLRVRVDDLDLKKPHAATLILIRKAVLIGKRGLFWLKLGFCCLALYHVLSFFASYAKTHEIERNARPATHKVGVCLKSGHRGCPVTGT